MKFAKFIKNTVLALAVTTVSMAAMTGRVAAGVPYGANGTTTSATPIFNNFYDVPNAVGNEADFVRVKPKAGGNADYVDTLNSACNNGDSYNVRTYVHNSASPDYNNNGSGSAVAHNVVVAMTAQLGSGSTFRFGSTISASNAGSVNDSGFLKCGDKTVKLTLVPGTVQTYSKPIGFQTVADSSVNGSLKVGSRAQGSGDQWACWEDRIIVVYEVKVEEVKTPPPTPVSEAICKVADGDIVASDNRTIKVTAKGETTNATVIGYEINWGDGSKVSTKQTDTHTYAKDGSYTIKVRVQVKMADGTTKWVDGGSCTRQVTFKPGEKPEIPVTPTTPTTPSQPTPTRLVNTGPGNLFGIFTVVSVLGAILHRRFAAVRNLIG